MHAKEIVAEFKPLEFRVVKFIAGEGKSESFEDLARAVFLFQMRHVPAVAAYARVRLGHAMPEDWREIPALPLEAFKRTRVSAFPREETPVCFRTSGTTGEVRGEHWMPSLFLYEAAVVSAWVSQGMPRLPQILLLPTPQTLPDSSLGMMFDLLHRNLGIPQHAAWQPGHRVDAGLVRHLVAEGNGLPLTLAGTALAILDLLEGLGEATLPLPPGSMVMETGGYKASGQQMEKSALYALITQKLGVPESSIYNEYGMTELSSQFYTRGLDAPHRGAPWVRALVIDPRTNREAAVGEMGVLRIFDLANVSTAMAIETRDLAVRAEEGFFLVGRDPNALPRGCSRLMEDAR